MPGRSPEDANKGFEREDKEDDAGDDVEGVLDPGPPEFVLGLLEPVDRHRHVEQQQQHDLLPRTSSVTTGRRNAQAGACRTALLLSGQHSASIWSKLDCNSVCASVMFRHTPGSPSWQPPPTPAPSSARARPPSAP
eukprot:3733630-Rhodomonas_salina.1